MLFTSSPGWVARLLPDRYRRWLVGGFLGVLLALGWAVVPDYGSFVDEDSCRESGQFSLIYLCELVPPRWLPARAAARVAARPPALRLAAYVDRDYGVAFELPLTILETLTTAPTDGRAVLLLRHRAVFLTCFAGLLAFYWLARERYGSWRWGLLGAALLLLSPRQLADAFYNSKDAVFMAVQLLATATALALVRRPTPGRAAAHALACALAIDVRIMGVLVPVLTAALLALRAARGDYAGQRLGRALAVYALGLPALVVAFWPYLWAAPLAHFGEAFRHMARFRWNGEVLYGGQLVRASRLPWHYAPVWIGLTTPPLYLAGLLLALGGLLRQLARRGAHLYATAGEWQDLLLWGLGLGPLVAVVAFRSVLYDGWRQLYFVYPPLLLLALGGLRAAWHWQLGKFWQPGQPELPAPGRRIAWRGALALVGLASAGHTAAQIMSLHPLENLYFSPLAGAHPELRYEYDYWGLSLRQGLAWIAAHDARAGIRVQVNQPLGMAAARSLQLLPPAARARLSIGPMPNAADHYFITTYRYHPQPYDLGPPLYSLRVQERRVFDIFRLR